MKSLDQGALTDKIDRRVRRAAGAVRRPAIQRWSWMLLQYGTRRSRLVSAVASRVLSHDAASGQRRCAQRGCEEGAAGWSASRRLRPRVAADCGRGSRWRRHMNGLRLEERGAGGEKRGAEGARGASGERAGVGDRRLVHCIKYEAGAGRSPIAHHSRYSRQRAVEAGGILTLYFILAGGILEAHGQRHGGQWCMAREVVVVVVCQCVCVRVRFKGGGGGVRRRKAGETRGPSRAGGAPRYGKAYKIKIIKYTRYGRASRQGGRGSQMDREAS